MKAAFIYNFAKYVEWPASIGKAPARPFVVGILGDDPFGSALEKAMKGQTVQGRAIAIRRMTRMEEIGRCDILFVASSERPHLESIFGALRNLPVLTIGEMESFAERGGMINLTTEGGRIRFEINVKAMDRAGLKADSQLLRLARIVADASSSNLSDEGAVYFSQTRPASLPDLAGGTR